MIKYDALVKFWPEYNNNLMDLFQFMDEGSEQDAWKMAALVALLGKDKHQIKPQRKGWDCLGQNAKCVSIARFLHRRDQFPIKYDRDKQPFSFIKDGKFADNGLKHSLSFEMSVRSMYAKAESSNPFHLPLGAAVIYEEWKTRDNENIMFGHIKTLVDVGYNRDNGWAVFLNGTTAGSTTVHLLGDVPGDIPWTSYPHSVITQDDLLEVRKGDKRNKTWLGRLVYST
jgi:hypothetical protein